MSALYRLLLVRAALTRPALTGHGLGHNTGPRIRIVACRLLQHCVGKCAEIGHGQVAMNAAARVLSSTHKYDRGLSRLLHSELRSDVPGEFSII